MLDNDAYKAMKIGGAASNPISKMVTSQAQPLVLYLDKLRVEIPPQHFENVLIGVLKAILYQNSKNMDDAARIAREFMTDVVTDDKKVNNGN